MKKEFLILLFIILRIASKMNSKIAVRRIFINMHCEILALVFILKTNAKERIGLQIIYLLKRDGSQNLSIAKKILEID